MGKAPSFQYYPADWRADAICGCSLAARGLWHEMLNMMHGTERYGYLQANGLPIPEETIARYCGCSLDEYQSLLSELDAARVPRRNHMSIIYCARMVNDQKQRDVWRKQKENQRDNGKRCPQDVRNMSALSSSSSSSTNLKPKATSGAQTAPVPPNYVEIVKNLAKTKTITPQQASFGKVKSIASYVLWLLGHGWQDNADLKDEVKRWCSQNGIDYSPDEIRRALDVGSGKAKSA